MVYSASPNIRAYWFSRSGDEKFKYKAKLKGKKKKGEIEAETLVIAKQKMRQDGFREVVLTEVKVSRKPASTPKSPGARSAPFRRRKS